MCVAGEVFCHEGQPYLCQGNTISGSLALGPVVNCGVAGCVIQDFELQELEALDDYDKYCGCSEPQHCLVTSTSMSAATAASRRSCRAQAERSVMTLRTPAWPPPRR